MGENRTIQATDKETVMEMYRSMNVKAFAIFDKMDLKFGTVPDSLDQGAQLLEQWLDWIENSNSAALYSLRVYRKVKDEEQITNKAAYHASINFRLNELSMAVGGAGGNAGYFGALNETLRDLQRDVKALQKQRDEREEEEEEEKGGFIGKLMNPEFIAQLPTLIGTVKALFSGTALPQYHDIPESEQLGAVGQSLPAESLTDDQRIEIAVQKLKQHVPDLADLLTKLATMAEKKPVMLKGALMILRTTKI